MPTAYPELNAVLTELVSSSRAILGENFCGAYLQGSFAVGDADEQSDVDFLVVTGDEIDEAQLAALEAMHGRLYALPSHWAQHLEGSYVPKARLRSVDPDRSPWLYLDNGATELIWDGHDNSAVVRSSLREHGVVLAGPDPTSLVDSVSAEMLRAEVSRDIDDFGDWLRARESWSARLQTLAVITYCRILHTLETGRVASKRESGEWALAALDPEWTTLIQRALDDRPEPWRKVHEVADPDFVGRTLEFVAYAVRRSRGTRSAVR